MTNPAFVVALVLGAAMLGAVIWVYVTGGAFGLGGSVLTVCGVILVGMSVWRTIDVSVDERGFKAKFEQLEKKVSQVQQRSDSTVKEVTQLRQSFDTRVAQDRLRDLGFYKGLADGSLGPATTLSIQKYQAAKGLPQTGVLDEPTRRSLEIRSSP